MRAEIIKCINGVAVCLNKERAAEAADAIDQIEGVNVIEIRYSRTGNQAKIICYDQIKDTAEEEIRKVLKQL